MKYGILENRFSSLLLSLLIIALFAMLGKLLIANAPTVKRLLGVQVKHTVDGGFLDKGSTLGWAELGQFAGVNSAEKAHMKVRFNKAANDWEIQNVAAKKRIDAKTAKLPTRYVRRMALQNGDELRALKFTLKVISTSKGRLTLQDMNTGVSAQWQGTALAFSDSRKLYNACERKPGFRRWLAELRDRYEWNSRGSIMEEKRLFSIGGNVDCTTRWKQAGVEPDSLRILWMDNQFWAGAGSAPLRVVIKRGKELIDLSDVPLSVQQKGYEVSRLILGRTHYKVKVGDGQLTLLPEKNQPLAFLRKPKTDAKAIAAAIAAEKEEKQRLALMKAQGVEPSFVPHAWSGDVPINRTIKSAYLALAAGISLLLAVLAVFFGRDAHTLRPALRITLALVTLGFSALIILAVRSNISLSLLLLSVVVTLSWATLMQFMAKRLVSTTTALWCLFLLLIGIGALVQTQLAAGAANTGWLKFPFESTFWIAQMGTWVALLALTPLESSFKQLMNVLDSNKRLNLGKRFSLPHPAYVALILLVSVLLLTQGLLGSEEGIAGIQPVELAKLLFVVIMARLLVYWHNMRQMQTRHYHETRYKIALGIAAQVIGAIIFGAAVLMVGVNDNSPLFIIGWLTLAYLWFAFYDPHITWSRSRVYGQGGLIALVGIIVLVGMYAYHNPPGYDSWVPQDERIRIWSNPALYPEAASQLISSLRFVGDGGWRGTGWFGSNGIVMALPAVQDDFIGAFALNRFGGFVGLLLVTVQCLWLFTCFALVNRLKRAQVSPEAMQVFQVVAYVLYGLVCLHLLHWLISWSNVLGWLPIMGQPMTWLSAGNSHMLALGIVTLLLSLMASWLFSERE